MKSRDWVVAEGRTVEEAVRTALQRLQAAEDEVEVVVEEEPRDGPFGLWRWHARVRVSRIAGEVRATADGAVAHDEGRDEGQDRRPPADAARPPAISMRQGEVTMVAPEGWDEEFLVYPGDRTRVWVNAQLIDGPHPVNVNDAVRVEAVDEEPETTVDVEISDDEYTASIAVRLIPGRRWRLVDAPPGRQLQVRARPEGPIAASLPTLADLRQALADHGVVYGISTDALRNLVQQLEQNPVAAARPFPVAFGVPMQPPEDERIELLFDTAERVQTFLEDHRADLLGFFKLSSVEPGQLLAVKHPGKPGKPGRTVTDKVVPVNEPREARISVGHGAAWLEDGRGIVATRGGRPMQNLQTIVVHPQHTVNGDAEAVTGHIEFDGDVLITGNVGESMRVVSKGSVSIGQSVAYATVEAEEAIVVARGVVKSKLVAGSRSSHLFQLMAYLQPLADDVGNIIAAVEEGVKGEADPGQRFETVGGLVKHLLDEKFVRVVRRIEALRELVVQGHGNGPHRDVSDTVHELHRLLVGPGPLAMMDLGELAARHRQLVGYVAEFEEQQSSPSAFDVAAGFVDNSDVLAAGRITLRRGGSYSRLWAGTGIVMESAIFRGTSLTVHRGDVRIKEVGGRTGAPVQIEIVTDGVFQAGLVHHGVDVTIGNRRHRFRQPARDVTVRLVEGELQIQSGLGGP